MPKVPALIKIHGGASYTAKWLVSLMPQGYEKMNYYELFAGGAAPLREKNPSRSEYLNELHPGLYDLWKWVIKNPYALMATLNDIVYSGEAFNADYKHAGIKYFVRARMSRGGLGKSYGWSPRLRRGMPENLSSWMSAIDNIPIIHDRVKNVVLTNGNALDALHKTSKWTSNDFLVLDPPWLPETRKAPKAYEYEMTREEHIELLELIRDSPAKIMILGYDSELYNSLLSNWDKQSKALANHSGQNKKKEKRVTIAWRNY